MDLWLKNIAMTGARRQTYEEEICGCR